MYAKIGTYRNNAFAVMCQVYYHTGMHVATVLENLGYESSQVAIYLALLHMGEGTIADIAQQVHMPRTTVAELVVVMNENGLVNHYVRKGRKYLVPENPEVLLALHREREAALVEVLPKLQAMQPKRKQQKPTMQLFVGIPELQNMMNDMIVAKKHIMAVVSWDDWREVMGSEFVDALVERRYKHFLRMRLITPKVASAKVLKRDDATQLRQTRFLPEHIELRNTSTFIYGDTVILISLNPAQPTGIRITDSSVAHGQIIYFESLWHHSSEQ